MTLEQSTEYERLKQAASSVWSAGNMYIGPSMRELMRFFGEYKRLSPEYEQPAIVPDGWKLVPVDPTQEMMRSGANVPLNKAARHNAVYRAMLAAAPAAPERDPELVRDAERYRWLRTYNTAKHPDVTEAFFLGDENLDAEIDAAIATEKGGA